MKRVIDFGESKDQERIRRVPSEERFKSGLLARLSSESSRIRTFANSNDPINLKRDKEPLKDMELAFHINGKEDSVFSISSSHSIRRPEPTTRKNYKRQLS